MTARTSARRLLASGIFGIALGLLSVLPAAAGELASAIERALLARAAEAPTEEKTARMVALAEFYVARDFEPLWVDEKGLSARGSGLAGVLASAWRDGLDPTDYGWSEISNLLAAGSLEDRARLEVTLSRGFLDYASHLEAGRVSPQVAAGINDLAPSDIEPLTALEGALNAEKLAEFVATFEPQQAEYRRLRSALAIYRGKLAKGDGWKLIPGGETIKEGMSDPRVPALRSSLVTHGDLSPLAQKSQTPELYDGALVEAVKRFQFRHGLEQDGVVGPKTLAALNVSLEARIEQMILNLERRRWMADDRGETFVFVNLADFHLKVVDGAKTIFDSVVVVGTEYNQTPVFSDEMEYVEINPYWNVPPKIARNELLPKIKNDPAYLASNNYELLSGWGAAAVPIEPASIDWQSLTGSAFNAYKLRQMPGEKNALGRIKFMFPNQYDVYLHDTPARSLFSRAERAFSHGCVRVGNPLGFAELILGREPGWDRARIEATIASGERTIVPLSRHIPVHIAYMTAWVNKDGTIHFRRDVYGRDETLARALLGPRT